MQVRKWKKLRRFMEANYLAFEQENAETIGMHFGIFEIHIINTKQKKTK